MTRLDCTECHRYPHTDVARIGNRRLCPKCAARQIGELEAIVEKAITWRRLFGGFREGHEELGHVATEEAEDELFEALLPEERLRDDEAAEAAEGE